MHRIILAIVFSIFTIQWICCNDKNGVMTKILQVSSEKNKDINKTIFFWRVDTKEKVVFLTFDDGPGQYTNNVLELLKKYNIKATFFVLGEMVKLHPEILKKVYESGHSIGSHTYYHNNFYKMQKNLSVDSCKKKLDEELKMTENEIKKVLPKAEIKFLRMPNGYYKNWVSIIAKNYEYKVVNWTFGCDWQNYTEEEMINKYKKALQPGCIYIFHDNGKNITKTIKVIQKVIEYCITNGYRIEKLDDWIN